MFLPWKSESVQDRRNQNFKKLVKIVIETVPSCKLEILVIVSADQWTYKADFSKLACTFPNFEFKWTAREGEQSSYKVFNKIGLPPNCFLDRRLLDSNGCVTY